MKVKTVFCSKPTYQLSLTSSSLHLKGGWSSTCVVLRTLQSRVVKQSLHESDGMDRNYFILPEKYK